MYSDIVIPNNNEQSFVDMALNLGYSKLYFLYEFQEGESFKSKIKKLKEFSSEKIEIELIIIVSKNKIEKARQFGKIIVKAESENRFFFEKKKLMIFGLESSKIDDFIFYRNSGLDQILCKLAVKNNNIVCFSFNSILNTEKYERAKIFGRIMQNIWLCRKYKVKTLIASFAAKPSEMRALHDLASLFQIIGIHPSEAQKAMNY